MTIKDSKAYKYAKWCTEVNNKYVGVYVKKQAEQWLKIADGCSDVACVDEKAFSKICKILKLMVHPDLRCSIYEGMEDYAWFLIVAVFCTKSKEDGSRYYETALLEICRKNFKTFNSAIIFIMGMLTEPKFSRFFAVAPDLDVSSELKVHIRKIISVSPCLQKHFRIKVKQVVCKPTDSEFTPLAYSKDRMDSRLANMFLADEAGALDEYPVEAMRSSQITIDNKLGIIISTQYPNDNNVMIDEIDYAKRVLDGLSEDNRYFSLLYEPDDNLRKSWETDDLVIYQSNPVAYSMPKVFSNIKKKREMAILYPNKKENYLCKHNNIMFKGLGTEGYIDIEKVKQCKISEDLEFWQGKKVFLGVDLSQTDDNTAVAMVTIVDGIIYAKVFGFVPEGKIEFKNNKERVDYNRLITRGDCFACGDEIIDYNFVENFVLSLPEKYGVEIVQLGFDRWNAISSVQKWESAENPIECVEIRQHSSILSSPTKLLYEYISEKKFRYDDNRLLEINFENSRCTYDTNLNKYVNKKKSSGKVDMVVALINAMYLLQQDILNHDDFVVYY
jgi:phage terminase large subunit-like protein